MPRLSEIPIRIELPTPRSGGLGGGVLAVLTELVILLEAVALGGAPAAIDLRSLPMSPQDRAELQAVLGSGEVVATIEADGTSMVRESGVSGLWWVEHRDRAGELIAEAIEIARIPAILETSLDEISRGVGHLRERIQSRGTGRREGSP